MDEYSNFETFLYISPEKLIISVNKKDDLRNIYLNELMIEGNNETDLLYDFLDKNIYKIEKILKNFIKTINIIIESDILFPVQMSVKRSNYGEVTSEKQIIYLLNEAKNEIKRTINNKKIIHMIINNYLVDNQNYLTLPNNLSCKSLCLDISFICLPINHIKKLEEILKQFQISVDHISSAKYLKSFLNETQNDLFKMCQYLIDGHNPNEVKIVPKIQKNLSFFERFFNYFS
tara:strand:- start:64 stop:759 length:696 start_codon:yes stop_codon:yes gene_type:complete